MASSCSPKAFHVNLKIISFYDNNIFILIQCLDFTSHAHISITLFFLKDQIISFDDATNQLSLGIYLYINSSFQSFLTSSYCLSLSQTIRGVSICRQIYIIIFLLANYQGKKAIWELVSFSWETLKQEGAWKKTDPSQCRVSSGVLSWLHKFSFPALDTCSPTLIIFIYEVSK